MNWLKKLYRIICCYNAIIPVLQVPTEPEPEPEPIPVPVPVLVTEPEPEPVPVLVLVTEPEPEPEEKTISPIWSKFINYVFKAIPENKLDIWQCYVHGNGEMSVKDFVDFDHVKMFDYMLKYGRPSKFRKLDKRWFDKRYKGAFMAYWAMSLMTHDYDMQIDSNFVGLSDLSDPFYRITYFTYLCKNSDEDEDDDEYEEIISQSRNYEILDKTFFSGDWMCFNDDFEDVQTIAISWIRANIAARSIQRLWREAIANPSYKLCEERLWCEANEIMIEF